MKGLAAFLDCFIFYDNLDLYFYISGLPKPEVTQEAKKKRRYDGRMETETISEKNSFTVCQFWLMTQLKSCYTCVIKWHAIPFKTIGWFYNRKLLKIQDRRLLYDTDINVTKRYTQYWIVNWTIESICKHKTEWQRMIIIVHNFMVFIHIIKGAITDFIPIVRACKFALISAG